MSPRTHTMPPPPLAPPGHPVPLPPPCTPAPLFLTHRGALPHLPGPLVPPPPPDCRRRLLQLPLSHWVHFNPSSKTPTTDLLSTFPGGGGAASYTGQPPAGSYLFLTTRAADSTEGLTASPGKAMSISLDTPTARSRVRPAEVLHLAAVLGVDAVEAPADAPPAAAATPASTRRAVKRSGELLSATVAAKPRLPGGVWAPVHGGVIPASRAAAAASVAAAAAAAATTPDATPIVGVVLAGLYAGESPDQRWTAVRTAIAGLPPGLPRHLAGGDGSPGEVLAAVDAGVDTLDVTWPFDMAEAGVAVDMATARHVRLRDWAYVRDTRPLVGGCPCWVCDATGVAGADGAPARPGGGPFTRAYLRHLVEVQELMASSLLAAHNLVAYEGWWARLRQAVAGGGGRWRAFVDAWEEAERRARQGEPEGGVTPAA